MVSISKARVIGLALLPLLHLRAFWLHWDPQGDPGSCLPLKVISLVTVIPSAVFLLLCHVAWHLHSSRDHSGGISEGQYSANQSGRTEAFQEKPQGHLVTCTSPPESGQGLTKAAVPVLSLLYFPIEMIRSSGLVSFQAIFQ